MYISGIAVRLVMPSHRELSGLDVVARASCGMVISLVDKAEVADIPGPSEVFAGGGTKPHA